jgi:hypothetical protein
VKLEIEKDPLTTIGQRSHDRGTFGSEELLADLEPADMTLELPDERLGPRG